MKRWGSDVMGKRRLGGERRGLPEFIVRDPKSTQDTHRETTGKSVMIDTKNCGDAEVIG